MVKKVAVALVAAALFVPLPASALQVDELLSLVAMPLAVAAVSETTDIPVSDLIDVVTLLNDAAVPPDEFIEVVRYTPVTLITVTETTTVERPRFVEFLRAREAEGLRGLTLVSSIEREIRTYGLPDVYLVDRPRIVTIDDDFIPVAVRTHISAARAGHPHGGPPGQLKKELGLKTGAEVVHRNREASQPPVRRVVTDRDDDRGAKPDQKARAAKPPKSHENHAGGKGKQGNGKGNGKGKEKG